MGTSEGSSLRPEVKDLCSQLLGVPQVREHPHDHIHMMGVEDGLQFLAELLPVWVKSRRLGHGATP